MKRIIQNGRSIGRMILMLAAVVMMVGTGSTNLFAAPPGETGPEHGGKFAKNFSSVWERAKDYSIQMAELMPEEHFGFKPTKDQMSFAEQLLHTVMVMNFAADKISGAAGPGAKFNPLKAEGKSKKDIIGLLSNAFDKVGKLLKGISDEEADKKIHVFGEGEKALHFTKPQLILMLRDHTTHHRGQMVVYLRLKGLKPPQYTAF